MKSNKALLELIFFLRENHIKKAIWKNDASTEKENTTFTFKSGTEDALQILE